ncbi:Hsp70 family protein [Vibrio sp. RC27]
MASPRYLVGIDLGTTNSVVAYCENTKELKNSPVEIFQIDQLVGPGEVVRRPLLPSFRYHPAKGQILESDLQLPWEASVVEGDFPLAIIGEWARNLGAQVEGRQVSSAKSWLSHQAVDRKEAILPWAANEDTEKVSPLIASASYLNHIRLAWNFHHPSFPLEQQEVVVTVPASFDESARKLTLEAAELAGLSQILLLEEPQAVFYDWYARYQDVAEEKLKDVPLVLVCDVGGGTTDLSLISAQHDENGLSLNRIGVGEHLMLGGDNIDLALAHITEQRLNGAQKLSAARLSKLIQQTRHAKESLLIEDAAESAKITLLGSGSKLLGGTKSVALSKEEVQNIAIDGFFPVTSFDEHPSQRQRAVVEFGLPYVSDPAVSKHVAQFLHQHQEIARQASGDNNETQVPVGLLLNGGVFNSPLIETRMAEVLEGWKGDPVTLLDNPHPDLSVALGAVSYAKARRGAQLKIGGGVARSYFLQLTENGKDKAICLLAKGTEESQEIRLTSRRFALTLGEPVRFNLLTTTHDTVHPNTPIQNGLLTQFNTEQFHPLPPYISSLAGDTDSELAANQKQRQEVYLASQLTPVGTLQVECVNTEDSDQRWLLEFEVRNQSTQSNSSPQKTNPKLIQATEVIAQLYSANRANKDDKAIKRINKDLESLLGAREEWDFETLRTLFDAIVKGKKRRRRSDLHEKHWLRLTGFSLRPGFGDAVDEWRIKQLWEVFSQGIQCKDQQTWSDWWTCWRRVSGGLDQDQQEQLLAAIAKYLHPGAHRNKSNNEAYQKGYDAMVRLAASLEHLEVEDKTLLANWFIARAQNSTDYRQSHWWAVGRLASRSLFYGSAHKVIPRAQAEQWLEKLLPLDWKQDQMLVFAVVMMCRKTGDRLLDISDSMRERVLEKLNGVKCPASWKVLMTEVSSLDQGEAKRLLGDSLPNGLRLVKE